YIAGSAAAIVVVYERDSRFGVSDASRAIQGMIVTAWADGVGSNWTGFGGLGKVREYVGLPDTYEVLSVVPFRYPERALREGKKGPKPPREGGAGDAAGPALPSPPVWPAGRYPALPDPRQRAGLLRLGGVDRPERGHLADDV